MPLTDAERVKLHDLITMGVSLAPHYRERLRARHLSWLGIPRAEQTPGRMARVLIVLDRPRVVPLDPYEFEAPCVPQMGPCDLAGQHTHRWRLILI